MNNHNKRFQKQVLELCSIIPKGKVTTYKEIAKAMNTKAYQAIGSALKNNKCPIKIPCHRVINSDGKLGGYKGMKNNNEKKQILISEGVEITENKINLPKFLFKFK